MPKNSVFPGHFYVFFSVMNNAFFFYGHVIWSLLTFVRPDRIARSYNNSAHSDIYRLEVICMNHHFMTLSMMIDFGRKFFQF